MDDLAWDLMEQSLRRGFLGMWFIREDSQVKPIRVRDTAQAEEGVKEGHAFRGSHRELWM